MKQTARPQDRLALNLNERRVFSLIMERGPISRAEVARTIDLSTPSVFRICDALSKRGLLIAGEPRAISGPGQPSLPLLAAPDAAFSLGISLTTEAATLVVADLTGRVRARRVLDGNIADRAATTQKVAKNIDELLVETGTSRHHVVGLGFAAPGYFIGRGSQLNMAGGLDEWSLVDLEEALGDALGYPVYVENEGNAAAIGESLYGHGVTHRSFAYVSIGFGLGGGLIVNGTPLRGAYGNAGELTTILPPEMRSDRPTLSGLLAHLRGKDIALENIGDLVRCFHHGWPIDDWLERCKAPLSLILSAISGVGDPALIVIGGLAPPSLLQRLIEISRLHLEPPRRGVERPLPKLIASALGEDAMALGAAALPFRATLFAPWSS